MSIETATYVISALHRNPQLETLDITGGAPELNPSFRYLVREAKKLGRQVIDRCNLTVLFVKGQEDLAEFLAEYRVRIIASLPCYLEENVDKQRGGGVFQESIAALKKFNALGYANETSELELDLVYNPLGPTLPPEQQKLENAYKSHLKEKYGIVFNRLFTLVNMPIARFKLELEQKGDHEKYLALLAEKFNSAAVENLMCRSLVSVGWDGQLYDCDFNQMLDLEISPIASGHIEDFDLKELQNRQIRTAEHCIGCTAGAGSSCTGALLK